MSVVDETIIQDNTIQVTSPSFSSEQVCTICASGIFGEDEGAKVQHTHDGNTWQDLYLDGVLQEIDSTHTMLTILGPGKFRVIKSATASPIAIVRWWSEVDG